MAQGLSQNDPVHPSRPDLDKAEESFNLKSIFKDRQSLAVFILFFIGLFLLAFGVGQFLLRGLAPNDDIKIVTSEKGDTLNNKIIVHVEGAIAEPGVYELSADSRVNDLIAKAGGLTSDADTQTINLAAKLADGQKIYIAGINDPVSKNYPDTGSGATQGLINVNKASEAQLDTLPSVGPVTAGKIIDGRPYGSVEELLSKKVLGKATYEKIKDLVGVY